jgi:transcriptional regulator with XRE-family HTH domain
MTEGQSVLASTPIATRRAIATLVRAAKQPGQSGASPEDREGAGRSSLAWRGAEIWARIVCQRLRDARLLNGLTIEQASERIGYGGNKTQLSLFETQARFPPLWAVMQAAIVYGVPLDYLFGLIEEDDVQEFGLERAALNAQMEAILARNAVAIAEVASEALQAGLPAVQMARRLADTAGRWIHAYDRFKARNPEQFGELPAGAMLESAAVALADAAIDAQRLIGRHDSIAERAAARAAKRSAAASAPATPAVREAASYDVSVGLQ